jgi:hypothetical protein
LQDDDGSYYIVFGACSGPVQPDDSCYYLSELHEDMVSYREPMHLSVRGAMGPYGPGKADDKPFLHKRGRVYYLSWGVFYATSTYVYGPYEYQGTFLETEFLAPPFRYGNESAQPWYTREDWADRHGSFVEFHGQWYFFCNDRSHSDAREKGFWPGGFRDTIASYVHYFDNGTIAPIIVDAKGVGSHNTTAESTLPAENYFLLDAGSKQQRGRHGFKLTDLSDRSTVVYKKVSFPKQSVVPAVRVAVTTACTDSMHVDLAQLQSNGSKALLARCMVPPGMIMGAEFTDIRCDRALPTDSEVDLHLSFHGCNGTNFLEIAAIAFH